MEKSITALPLRRVVADVYQPNLAGEPCFQSFGPFLLVAPCMAAFRREPHVTLKPPPGARTI